MPPSSVSRRLRRQEVVVVAANEQVIACGADERIIAGKPADRIFLARSNERVVAGIADNGARHVRHRDRNVLRCRAAVAVGDRNGDIVDVVAAGIGRGLEVGRRLEAQRPAAASIVNSAASAPPVIEKVSVCPASGSVAVTVVTAAPFSATETAAVSPPPSEVMVGYWLIIMSPTSHGLIRELEELHVAHRVAAVGRA